MDFLGPYGPVVGPYSCIALHPTSVHSFDDASILPLLCFEGAPPTTNTSSSQIILCLPLIRSDRSSFGCRKRKMKLSRDTDPRCPLVAILRSPVALSPCLCLSVSLSLSVSISSLLFLISLSLSLSPCCHDLIWKGIPLQQPRGDVQVLLPALLPSRQRRAGAAALRGAAGRGPEGE